MNKVLHIAASMVFWLGGIIFVSLNLPLWVSLFGIKIPFIMGFNPLLVAIQLLPVTIVIWAVLFFKVSALFSLALSMPLYMCFAKLLNMQTGYVWSGESFDLAPEGAKPPMLDPSYGYVFGWGVVMVSIFIPMVLHYAQEYRERERKKPSPAPTTQ